jgi:hypothetical protein
MNKTFKIVFANLVLCACPVLGRTVSLDLRKPAAKPPMAMLQAAAPHSADGTLRRANLDAGAADVGEVAAGDKLEVALFDDVRVTLRLARQMPAPLGGEVFIAEAAGHGGVKNAVVLRTANGLTIDFTDSGGGRVYKVVSGQAGVLVQEIKPVGNGRCGADELAPPSSANAGGSPEAVASPRQSALSLGEPSAKADSYVDILVAYDGNAATWADENGGGITNFAEVAVQKMNMALANTDLDRLFSFRLVGVVQVDVSSDDLDAVLDNAAYGIGDWAPIKKMRDEVCADIVTILVDTGSAYGMTGLGWSLVNTPVSTLRDFAYNACSIRSVAQAHTMTHEVGHNMGAGHSDLQATVPGPQLYDYSAGYYFTGTNEIQYCTVMTYEGEGPGGELLPYFSSPNHSYAGVAVGDETHDNTRTLANTYAEVSLFRTSFMVEFNANGGELEESTRRVKGGAAVGALPTPKREQYAFLGWFTTVEGGVRLTEATRINAAAMYYAHWRYVGSADESHIYLNIGENHSCNPDGTFSLGLSELVESYSDPKLVVKGLPSGIKFDAKTMTISGKATKPGTYKVTVSATNATVKKPVSMEFALTVPNLTSDALPNLEPAADAYGVVMCGVAFNPGWIDCAPEAGWTVKAAGLPAGLKLVQDKATGAYAITGVPTKAGTNTVTFTASKKGEANQVATITLATAALPAWAQGTFAGWARAYGGEPDYEDDYGAATMTVGANGKVSGKIALMGTNWTFAAASYAASDGGDNFEVSAEAKAGKATMPLWLMVRRNEVVAPYPGGELANASVEGWLGAPDAVPLSLWRNIWKDKETAAAAKAEIAKWEGLYTLSLDDGGYVSLAVGKDGTVKATGKLADGTAVSTSSPLMYNVCWDGFFTMLCTSPSAYKGGFFVLPVGFGVARGPLREIGAGPVVACSRNPQATGEYGAGFVRHLTFAGAYYDKTKRLNDYYGAMRLQLDSAPTLQYGCKITSLDEGGRKKTVTVADATEAVDTLGQAGLTAAVNEKGAFVVEKATKPVQNRETKEWSYNGPNDGAMSLSFAQATGVFKGAYTLWYDYVSAYDETVEPAKATKAHTSKKVSFEGILVPGMEEMRGFYLWDATGAYENPKTDKEKTYKYKETHSVTLSAQ